MGIKEVRRASLRATVALAIASLTLFVAGTARAQLTNYGTYIITNVHSGLALGDPAAAAVTGPDVEQLAVTSGTSQQWTVTNQGGSVFTLTNASSGQFLDVVGASTASGALIDVYPANGNANQNWTAISLGGGHYEVTSQHSGLALTVVGEGTNNGAEIEQAAYTGSASQQWVFTALGPTTVPVAYGCLPGPHPGFDPTSTLGPPSGNCLVDPTVEGYTGVPPVQGAAGTTTFQLTALASGNWSSAGIHTVGNYQIGHSSQLPDQQVAYFEFNFAPVQGRTVTAAFFLIPGSTDYDIGVVYPTRCNLTPTGPCFKVGIRPQGTYSTADIVDASSNHNVALATAAIGNQNDDIGYWPWVADGLHLNTEFGAFTYKQSAVQDQVNAGGLQVIWGADDFDSGESNLSGGGVCAACPGGFENYIWGSTGYNTGIIFLLTVEGGEASIPVVPNGTYVVKNLNSGGALEVAAKTAVEEHLDEVVYAGDNKRQMWKVTRLADGNYTIRNAGTGSLLEDSEEWSIIPATGGNYTLKSVKTGKMLDVAGGSSLMGMGIVQAAAKPGYANQQWSFLPSNSNPQASLIAKVNANQQ